MRGLEGDMCEDLVEGFGGVFLKLLRFVSCVM